MELPKVFHPVELIDKDGNKLTGRLNHTGSFCTDDGQRTEEQIVYWKYIWRESYES